MLEAQQIKSQGQAPSSGNNSHNLSGLGMVHQEHQEYGAI
jgi:hypothetical protein